MHSQVRKLPATGDQPGLNISAWTGVAGNDVLSADWTLAPDPGGYTIVDGPGLEGVDTEALGWPGSGDDYMWRAVPDERRALFGCASPCANVPATRETPPERSASLST